VVHLHCCMGIPIEYINKLKKWDVPFSETYPATNKELLNYLEDLIKRDGLL